MARPVLRAVQITVTLGLLALLWRLVDGQAALAHLAGAQPLWLAGALALLTAQTVLSALRWRLTAGQFGIRLDLRTALSEYYLSQIVNQVLPGGVLGDAGRALRARVQSGLMASGQAVLFERLAGQIALFALFAGAVLASLALPGGFQWLSTMLLAPLLSLIAGITGFWLVLWSVGPRLPGRTGSALGAFKAAFRRALWAPRVRLRQIATSLGTALLNVAAFACCAAAVGVHLPPLAALVLVPPILLMMLVPITVSGWGLREGAAAALLLGVGATAAEGLAASVAFGLTLIVAALPGAVAAGRMTRIGAVNQ